MFISQPTFLPARFSEVKAWYSGFRSAHTLNGSNVSQWNNLIDSNHATQVTATNQYLFVQSGPASLPTMRADGVNDFFDLVTPSVFGMQSADWEMLCIGTSSDSVNAQFILAAATLGNFDVHINLSPSIGFRMDPNGTASFATIGALGAFTDGNPHIFSARVDSDTGIVRVDGTDGGVTVNPARSAVNTTLRIGTRGNGTFPLDGDVSEYIICQPALSTVRRTTMELYLKNLYGTP